MFVWIVILNHVGDSLVGWRLLYEAKLFRFFFFLNYVHFVELQEVKMVIYDSRLYNNRFVSLGFCLNLYISVCLWSRWRSSDSIIGEHSLNLFQRQVSCLFIYIMWKKAKPWLGNCVSTIFFVCINIPNKNGSSLFWLWKYSVTLSFRVHYVYRNTQKTTGKVDNYIQS